MSNYDEKTGIAYGVISPHAISPYALDDIYQNGTDPHYEYSKNELMDAIKSLCENHGIDFKRINTDLFEDEFNDHFESCGDGQMDYEDKEYTLHVSGDNFGIFVIRSPYYTYCRPCSPCAPGAGDLNNPMTSYDGPVSTNYDNAYCLGKDYFEDEKAPYRIFRVEDDLEVI
jgi:hypothetical protein